MKSLVEEKLTSQVFAYIYIDIGFDLVLFKI